MCTKQFGAHGAMSPAHAIARYALPMRKDCLFTVAVIVLGILPVVLLALALFWR
jgi:hypothetical protein